MTTWHRIDDPVTKPVRQITAEEMDQMGPKVFSVVMAFACFRHAIGGRDEKYSVDDCVRWLRCMEQAAQGEQ